MKVNEYRTLITAAERKVFQDIHACKGRDEIICWFGECFNAFNALTQAECARATAEDAERADRAADTLSTWVTRYESEWQEARKRFLDHRDDLDAMSNDATQIAHISKLSQALKVTAENIKVYRSALHHFESDASEFKVRQWKTKLNYYMEQQKNNINLAQALIDKVEASLKQKL